jgi:hypothetical protein
MSIAAVGMNIDTFILNVKSQSEFPSELAAQLDHLKQASQDVEDDLPTPFNFAGETLFIKPHGSGRQWRWILHSPSLHLDIGRGKRTAIIGKARLAAAFLWEHEIGAALSTLYGFVDSFYGVPFTLQVSEVHLCVDVAGWALSLNDTRAFIARSVNKGLRLEDGMDDQAPDEDLSDATTPLQMQMSMNRRRCSTFDFSKGGTHSCCIYDKTAEITVSRKDWMQEVWATNGWDCTSRVTRVEFRYKRECLKQMGVEEAYAFLDQIPGLWAYSTKRWLRHTVPTPDPNRARWPLSEAWREVQKASFFCDGTPAVRERKTAGDLKLICQMMAGCSSTASALLTNVLPAKDDGTHFLIWFWDWLEKYLDEKGITFEQMCAFKRERLGVVPHGTAA